MELNDFAQLAALLDNLIGEAEEVDKLESFFRPKPITKKRKK